MQRSRLERRRISICVTLCLHVAYLAMLLPVVVLAQTQDAGETQQSIEQLQIRVVELDREYQRRLDELQRQTDEQMRLLQDQIDKLNANAGEANPLPQHGQTSALPLAVTVDQPENKPERLNISGDFRLRYEANSSYGTLPSWDRGVLRGRLAASYLLDDGLILGARLVTGDSQNPRTSDLTIGDFGSDLEVSLDQAYVTWAKDRLTLTGGKFAKPFNSTELVWDGDVNPQGFAARYRFAGNSGWSASFAGIYLMLDEKITAPSSDMRGGQFSLAWRPAPDWKLSLDAAYYDYDIGTLSSAGAGNPRGNNIKPGGGAYLSDFDLLDTMATLQYSGWGEQWNFRLVADHVKNLGAEVPQDAGYGIDLFLGNLNSKGHYLFRYGYSRVETDAVLGLYSNDNIILATNYELHTFTVDYALSSHSYLGLTSYLFRQLDFDPALNQVPNDWSSRTRLNLLFQF